MISGKRVTEFAGCLNFRHMGGYRTDDGRITRADRLFRSGWLNFQTQQDVDLFASFGISSVFDFRLEEERLRNVMNFPPAYAPQVTSLEIGRGSMGPYLQKIAGLDPAHVDTKGAVTTMYYEILDEGREQFRTLLNRASEGNGAIMINCTLGKDRTGVASALLLSALGVSRVDVMADYMITAETLRAFGPVFVERSNYAARGLTFDLVRDLLTVHPEYLGAMWRRAEDVAGSMDAYLEHELGVTAEQRARLKALYTV